MGHLWRLRWAAARTGVGVVFDVTALPEWVLKEVLEWNNEANKRDADELKKQRG